MDKNILEAAERAEPELMKKTALAVSLIEKMAPEFLDDVFQDFETISEITIEKVAGVPDVVRKALPGAIGVAAIVGTGAAAALGSSIATDLFDVAKRGLTKSRSFKRILEHNPNLHDEVHDKGRLKPAFNALHRYAPEFMADPLVGGSLLKQLANQPGGNEYQLITALLGARKNLSDVKKSQFNLDPKMLKGPPKGGHRAIASGLPGATETNE